jgi:hypothetical protein
MVSATERRAGARVFAAAVADCDSAGGLVAYLRPGPVAWALAGLDAVAEEGPAMGEGEDVDVCACESFAGTLSTSDVWVCGGEVAAAVDVEVWGGD